MEKNKKIIIAISILLALSISLNCYQQLRNRPNTELQKEIQELQHKSDSLTSLNNEYLIAIRDRNELIAINDSIIDDLLSRKSTVKIIKQNIINEREKMVTVSDLSSDDIIKFWTDKTK